MTADPRTRAPAPAAIEESRRARTDPRRLKAFARRLNLMLGEMGLPERGRAKLIKERVGVSGTTAANWLRGQSYPSFEELARMGRLGLDPSRLFPSPAEHARTAAQPSVSEAAVSRRLARLIESSEVVPVLQLRTEDGDWDHAALPTSFWPAPQGSGLAGCVLLRMKGDAMGERLRDGTTLLVDTNATRITDDNGIYVLMVGEALLVRRVQRRLQGGYLIACDNPAIATETVDRLGSHRDEAASEHEALVLGRVAAAIQRL